MRFGEDGRITTTPTEVVIGAIVDNDELYLRMLPMLGAALRGGNGYHKRFADRLRLEFSAGDAAEYVPLDSWEYGSVDWNKVAASVEKFIEKVT